MSAPHQALLMSGAVAAAATPILDTYGSGIVGAWSMARKLKTGATNAFRARYSSDTVSLDVGFGSGGESDTSALVSAVGSGSARVQTLYDQSGNAIDLTMATDSVRPIVIDSGALQTLGGKPCGKFGAAATASRLTSAANFGTTYGLSGNLTTTIFIVFRKTNGSTGDLFGWGDTNVSLKAIGQYDDGSSRLIAFSGGNSFVITAPTLNTNYYMTVIKTAGAINTTTTARRNAASVASTGHSTATPNVDGAGSVSIGRWANYTSNYFGGLVAEMLIYSSDKSTDLAAIEANIAAFYGI